jgi:hypothetical protein
MDIYIIRVPFGFSGILGNGSWSRVRGIVDMKSQSKLPLKFVEGKMYRCRKSLWRSLGKGYMFDTEAKDHFYKGSKDKGGEV